MKVLWYGPHWLGLEFLPRSLAYLGHDLTIVNYVTRTGYIPEGAFDCAVAVGIPDGPGMSLPFHAIRERCPLILLSPEASELGKWHSRICEWIDGDCADLIVNIDGDRQFPHSDRCLTLLTPVDPTPFAPLKPWAERTISFGFGGGFNNPKRSTVLGDLGALITVRDSGMPNNYAAYAEFTRDCRVVLNFCWHGADDGGSHVKGRIIEAATAEALVLEVTDSPTNQWFTPGEDYLEWETLADIERHVAWSETHPAEAWSMASRLRKKVLAQHSPAAFWNTVFSKVGVCTTTS